MSGQLGFLRFLIARYKPRNKSNLIFEQNKTTSLILHQVRIQTFLQIQAILHFLAMKNWRDTHDFFILHAKRSILDYIYSIKILFIKVFSKFYFLLSSFPRKFLPMISTENPQSIVGIRIALIIWDCREGMLGIT